MGRLSREKGARWERRLANWMNALRLGSLDWRRELRETQQGNVGDVREITGQHPLVIQGKHEKQPSPWKATTEAREGATTSEGNALFGVACIRRHGGEDLVCMRPDTFAVLLEALRAATDHMDVREWMLLVNQCHKKKGQDAW